MEQSKYFPEIINFTVRIQQKFPKINEEKTTTGECETVARVLRRFGFF